MGGALQNVQGVDTLKSRGSVGAMNEILLTIDAGLMLVFITQTLRVIRIVERLDIRVSTLEARRA